MEEGDTPSGVAVTPSVSLVTASTGGAEVGSPSIKRALVMEPEPMESPIAHTLREQKTEYGGSQLQGCLDYIHKQLHR